jgi:phage terminase large subunit GpA-like protein
VLHKKYNGGFVLALGANSPAPLRADTVRGVILDEVDGYPDSAGREGDVATLAMQRNIKFPNAKTILTSTPTIRHFSQIENRWLRQMRDTGIASLLTLDAAMIGGLSPGMT